MTNALAYIHSQQAATQDSTASTGMQADIW